MFQLLYLRFTQPRADPTAFAAMASQAQGAAREPDGEPGRRVQPDASTPRSAGNSPRRQPETPATVDQWNLDEVAGVLQGALRRREQLHVRLRRQLHARGDQAARRDLHRQPAGDARARDLARPRHHAADAASSRRPSRRASRRRAQVAIVFSGPFEYDDAHMLALRTMTLLLQSRLLDTIRAGARRHLQHHRRRRTPTSSRGRNTACGSTGRAIRRARRRWCSACSRRSRSSGTRCSRREQVARIRDVAAARVRAEQPGQRLSAQPDRRAATRTATRRNVAGDRRTCRPRSPR